MKAAVGTDIVDIEKIRGSFARWGQKFINRLLTPHEHEYCRSKVNFLQSVAGKVASKEAVYKALYQLGVSGLSWKDIEVVSGPTNAPEIHLSERAQKVCPNIEISISISHTESYAVAVVYVEKQ
jgi:holo-[acyl-carrier protein] synthase